MSQPRKKLIERFEVLGVQLSDQEDPPEAYHYQGRVNGTVVRTLLLHYPTHLDARLGAAGLRAINYTILGIRDLHTDQLVDDSKPRKEEVMPSWK